MPSIELTKEQGEELDLPWECHTKWSEGSRRWHEDMAGVFEYEGKNYMIFWSEGLTEMQENEDPWYYSDTINCPEAEQYTVTRTEWRVKSD